MKRFMIILLLLVCAAPAARAQGKNESTPSPRKPTPRVGKSTRLAEAAEPKVLREVDLSEVEPPVRVKLQLRHGRPMIGRLIRVDAAHVTLDTQAEPDEMPGKFRFRRADVVTVWELSPLTEAERQAAREARQQRIKVIRAERAEERSKRAAEAEARETAERSRQEDYKQALDQVVSEEQEARMRALLEEFPPPAWNEARYNEIRDNWRLRDLPPNKDEARFVSIYAEWRRARDTIRILDAKKNAERGDQLLLRFPTAEGWGADRLERIKAKQAAGEALTVDEADFLENYRLWLAAVLRRSQQVKAAEEQQAEGTAGEKTPGGTEEPK
jgi:hypothetical protein